MQLKIAAHTLHFATLHQWRALRQWRFPHTTSQPAEFLQWRLLHTNVARVSSARRWLASLPQPALTHRQLPECHTTRPQRSNNILFPRIVACARRVATPWRDHCVRSRPHHWMSSPRPRSGAGVVENNTGRPPLLAPPERTDRSGSRCSRARAGPSGGGAERRRRAGSRARWSAPERGGALQGGRARWSRSGSRCSRPRAAPSGGGGLRRRGAGSGARWSAGGRPSEVERRGSAGPAACPRRTAPRRCER